MPVLPTIADTYRVTLNWNLAHGIEPHNVIHVRKTSSNEAGVLADLDVAFGDLMWEPIQQDWAFTTVDILKLDGSSATQTLTTAAAQGSLTSGDAIVSEACVITMRTAQRGSRGRGRVFLGPLAESKQAQGIWTGDDVGAAWAAFADSLQLSGSELVVASYVHADAHAVTSIRHDARVGTQRRRLLQLG